MSSYLDKTMLYLLEEKKDTLVNYCDSISVIKLSRNLIMYGRSKHVDMGFHLMRYICKDRVIKFEYCKTGEQINDISQSYQSNIYLRN